MHRKSKGEGEEDFWRRGTWGNRSNWEVPLFFFFFVILFDAYSHEIAQLYSIAGDHEGNTQT
jgi:hypothetical protein